MSVSEGKIQNLAQLASTRLHPAQAPLTTVYHNLAETDVAPSPDLVQARAAEGLQVVLPLSFLFNWHLNCDPGDRNIGLRQA